MATDMQDKFLKSANNDWYKQRLTTAMFLVMIIFATLIIRLFYLQVIEGKEYRRLSENNCIRLQDTPAPRGLIFDRNGELLVDNRPAFDLYITLKDAAPVTETIERLSLYTQIPRKELKDAIQRHKRTPSYKPILLKADIGRNALAAVEVHQFELPGVMILVRSIRNYVFKESAAHLIGYLGEINADELKRLETERNSDYHPGDLIGKFGIEKSAECYLKGERGGRQVEVNSSGQVIRVLNTVDARPGYNIFLTIDHELQKKAETLINEIPASVVAIVPETGEILVLASNPTFDPNAFVGGISHVNWRKLISNPFRAMENKAIQGEYPPASTYKIVTAIAGLEEGVIDEKTVFYCPGYYQYGDRIFRCWRRGGHGSVNVVKALAVSCDVFFYQVGQKLGADRLAKYAKALGLGDRTGISLDHESRGLIPTTAWKKKRFGIEWMSGENLSIAIGQGYNLCTPVQMAVLTATIANNGIRHKPIIVRSIETVDGDRLDEQALWENGEWSKKKPPPFFLTDSDESGISLPVSPQTLEIVRKGLWDVVNGWGTARRARIEGIDVCGKTGTAQVVGRKESSNNTIREANLADHLKAHAWFVAYAPSQKPEIAVAVMVENGEHGSSTAAPVARELIRLYLKKREFPSETPIISTYPKESIPSSGPFPEE